MNYWLEFPDHTYVLKGSKDFDTFMAKYLNLKFTKETLHWKYVISIYTPKYYDLKELENKIDIN